MTQHRHTPTRRFIYSLVSSLLPSPLFPSSLLPLFPDATAAYGGREQIPGFSDLDAVTLASISTLAAPAPAAVAPSAAVAPPVASGGAATSGDLAHLTVEQLKDILRSRSINMTGNKAELVEKARKALGGGENVPQDSNERASNNHDQDLDVDYSQWRVEDLKTHLRNHGKKVSGNRAELIQRVTDEC